MLTFTTENSTYSVRIEKGLFAITKIGESNPESTFNQLGQVRYSDRCYIAVGDRAHFAGWRTSVVKELVEHREVQS